MRPLMLVLAMAFATASPAAFAAPGDPFGDDDAGCTPTTVTGLSCAKKVGTLVAKFRSRIARCQLVQASQAFKTGHSSPGFDNAEENCELGSATSAVAKFDDKLADYAALGCDPTLIANAASARDTLLAALDAYNGAFFCDDTSGLTISEPGGGEQEEQGYIPASANNYKCAFGSYKAWVKLYTTYFAIHAKVASAVYKGVAYDEEAAELKASLKYFGLVDTFVAVGLCSPCLAAVVDNLGLLAAAESDGTLDQVYICPGP
jgi:hypothetical protein